VLGIAVVVVAGDVAVVALVDASRGAGVGVPDAGAPAVLPGSTLDLVGGGRRPPQKSLGEHLRCAHCLTAPCMMPETSWRPATMNRISSGTVASSAPARTSE